MIEIGVDEERRVIAAYASQLYIDTDLRLLRIRIAKTWLNSDGSVFRKKVKDVVLDNSVPHHYDGETEEQVAVGSWDYWMSRDVDGPVYQCIADLIESAIVDGGWLEDM